MESRVPSTEERILPRVRHRQNVVKIKMFPVFVANCLPVRRGRWLAWVSICPLIPNKVVVLFAPHHPAERLSLDVPEVVSHGKRANAPIEFVGFCSSLFYNVVE